MDAHLDPHDAPEAPQAFKTHPELLAGMGVAEKRSHKAKTAALAGMDASRLCARLETEKDPAMLWPIHQELASRGTKGIPPILRGPRGYLHGLQGDFLDFAADLQWLWSTETIKPRHRLAQAIFEAVPGTPTWWQLVARQYAIEGTRNTRGWSIAFNLDATQRRHLRTIQSADTRRLFDDLHDERFTQLRETVRMDAAKRPPDKAPPDKRRPLTDIASRRARIFRTHKLTAGSLRDTARNWEALSKEKLSAQAIRHQVDLVAPTFKQLRADWSKAQTE